jgi:hypothetical protein
LFICLFAYLLICLFFWMPPGDDLTDSLPRFAWDSKQIVQSIAFARACAQLAP